MRNIASHLLCSLAAFTALTLMPLAAEAQSAQPAQPAQSAQPAGVIKYKQVKGWVINQYAGSESSATPSCSAVHFKDRSDAIRIERFQHGYLYGLNGLSRKQQGVQYPFSVWFDSDKTSKLSGNISTG